MTIYEKAKDQEYQLKNRIRKLQGKLKNAPEGSLEVFKNGNHYKWYLFNPETGARTNLPKKQRAKAELLARKRVREYLLHDAEHELHAIQLYLRHHQEGGITLRKLLRYEGLRDLAASELDAEGFGIDIREPRHKASANPFESISDLRVAAGVWQATDYSHNPNHQENLIVRTTRGEYVRSKSDAMSAAELYAAGIPYKYECPIELMGTTIYPDFTIFHPSTGEIWLWEHFGMMDKPAYARNAAIKIQNYLQDGYIPGMNFIATYETQTRPLSIDAIANKINEYLV